MGASMADPNVFFGTTIIFPNAVDKGRAQGFDVRLEVPRWRGWSGYASSSVGKVVQTAPITGGLFLEDEVADLEPGEEFLPDHDQRVVAGRRRDLGPRRVRPHAVDVGPLRERNSVAAGRRRRGARGAPGAEMVDFDSGRMKPRFLVSLVAAVPLVNRDRLEVVLRGSVLNLFNRAYAFNFGNPFSGTHFGAPLTATVGVQVNLK